MKEYHHAWLKAHPKRTEEWLKTMLREGFDIHHLDGNHKNNEPNNLVLIEGDDHMRIHGRKASRIISDVEKERRRKARLSIGEKALALREDKLQWWYIAKQLDCTISAARTAAFQYAESVGKTMPKGDPSKW